MTVAREDTCRHDNVCVKAAWLHDRVPNERCLGAVQHRHREVVAERRPVRHKLVLAGGQTEAGGVERERGDAGLRTQLLRARARDGPKQVRGRRVGDVVDHDRLTSGGINCSGPFRTACEA